VNVHRAALRVPLGDPGGRVLGVEDADGNEIRGELRRKIIKSLPRYSG
jgi:hypothetical protein